MNASLWSIWNSAARLGIVKPTTVEMTLLILLGASLLALRAFRENYLKIWLVGWAALLASQLSRHMFGGRIPAPFDLVVVQASFVLAAGLFAGAILRYARIRDLFIPLAVITPILVGFSGARVLLWPDSLPLRMAVEVGYRILLLTASIALLRARRGRFEPSAWLLALCLPLLHLDWSPFTDQISATASLAIEIALGISLLLVVIEQARSRNRRLTAMQTIATSIASAQQHGSIVQCTVDELKRVMRVRSAWFRLVESGHLVATHAAGLSNDFLLYVNLTETTENVTKLWEKREPQITKSDKA